MLAKRVLVVDDHPLMRQALSSVIADEPDFIVVGEAENGEQAISQAQALNPDVIVMDLYMPVKDGLSAAAELTAARPETRILALTSSTLDSSALAAVEAGALGYILKDAHPEEFLQALRQVTQGNEYWPPAAVAKIVRGLRQHPPQEESELTGREQEVLNLLGDGLSNNAIAKCLCISEATVRAHVYHILQKLGLENRTQAALYLERGKKSSPF